MNEPTSLTVIRTNPSQLIAATVIVTSTVFSMKVLAAMARPSLKKLNKKLSDMYVEAEDKIFKIEK